MTSRQLHVSRVDPMEDPQWDAACAQFPGASFFHSRAWLQVLRDSYGLTPSYFRAERADQTAALIPLMEVNSWLTGRRGVSLPFSDGCQPLAADAAALRATIDAIAAHASARRWKYWELRGGAASIAAPASSSYFGHRLALSSDTAWLFSRCDSAARRAVRKSEQAGLAITFSHDLASTRQFHALLCKTRRRHGVPPQPFRFFANIQRHILAPRHGCIALARLAGVPIAGAMFFHFGRSALFKFGASDDAHQQLRPNNFVMWRAIEWHARAGFAALDFGRTDLTNEGLRRFKLGWGATEHHLDYIRFDCRAAAFVKGRDASPGWPNGLFKLLPVAVSRLLGAAAYRHVA